MYTTNNIGAVATITELRTRTSELVESARELDTGILIQKNSEPHAVLVSSDRYDQLINGEEKLGDNRS